MSKAIITVGYSKYIVEPTDALKLAEILERAERLETKWDAETGKSYFVYAQEPDERVSSIELMPDDLYRMAKLAGRPPK